MKKVFMVGFEGPWGWLPAFKSTHQHTQNDFELVDTITKADIVYQADTSHWQLTAKYLSKNQKLICNVLDFAHWKYDDGRFDPSIVEYVEKLVSRADSVGCISADGIRKLDKHFNIKAGFFAYPSQFYTSDFDTSIPKKRVIVKVARLADPGKRVDFLLDAWQKSKAASEGWRFILVGPEKYPGALPKGVMYSGYLDVEQLKLMIQRASYLIMGRKACGLGLPAIEAALLGTLSIMKFAEPMDEMWPVEQQLFYANDETLVDLLEQVSHEDFYRSTLLQANAILARPWARDIAFDTLQKQLNNA